MPIDRLPGHDEAEHRRCEDRWTVGRGQQDRERVLALIRDGAGEDFLQRDVEAGRLPTLTGMWDLRGLQIHGETLRFPEGDTFESIDFGFASFWHTTFENAVFESAMRFGRVCGCTFTRCIFIHGHCFATRFEDCQFVDCDFIESFSFTNCDFRSVDFCGCYLGLPMFDDCRFDAATRVSDSSPRPVRGFNAQRDLKRQSTLYIGISEAYRSGGAREKARDALFEALCAETRHNRDGARRAVGYVKEFVFGYGLRPGRVLRALVGMLIIGTAGFTPTMPPRDAFLVAAGAVFTFGVHADRLDQLAPLYSVLYTLLAFGGISLIALLAAVWARVFFADE